MNNFENLKKMSLDDFTAWLDKNGMFDNSPWLNSFNKKYCDNCESVECHYEEAKEKLGITPFYDNTIECAYCEVYKKCRFFEHLEDVPDNKDMIKMWLEEEAK